MREISRYISFESASNGISLSKYWVYKHIIEMETHGCTSITCICGELLGIHALKERHHEMPIWKEYLDLKKVVDYISHISAIQFVYSSMDWVFG